MVTSKSTLPSAPWHEALLWMHIPSNHKIYPSVSLKIVVGCGGGKIGHQPKNEEGRGQQFKFLGPKGASFREGTPSPKESLTYLPHCSNVYLHTF